MGWRGPADGDIEDQRVQRPAGVRQQDPAKRAESVTTCTLRDAPVQSRGRWVETEVARGQGEVGVEPKAANPEPGGFRGVPGLGRSDGELHRVAVLREVDRCI